MYIYFNCGRFINRGVMRLIGRISEEEKGRKIELED